jgi:hypothetical protein
VFLNSGWQLGTVCRGIATRNDSISQMCMRLQGIIRQPYACCGLMHSRGALKLCWGCDIMTGQACTSAPSTHPSHPGIEAACTS